MALVKSDAAMHSINNDLALTVNKANVVIFHFMS